MVLETERIERSDYKYMSTVYDDFEERLQTEADMAWREMTEDQDVDVGERKQMFKRYFKEIS